MKNPLFQKRALVAQIGTFMLIPLSMIERTTSKNGPTACPGRRYSRCSAASPAASRLQDRLRHHGAGHETVVAEGVQGNTFETILALVGLMLGTRRIDWYRLGKRADAEPETR